MVTQVSVQEKNTEARAEGSVGGERRIFHIKGKAPAVGSQRMARVGGISRLCTVVAVSAPYRHNEEDCEDHACYCRRYGTYIDVTMEVA